MELAKRVFEIKESGIRKMFAIASQIKNPIDLSIGQTHFQTPKKLQNALSKATKQGFNRYTHTMGIPSLIEKIKNHYLKKYKKSPEGLIITSGASGGIVLSLLAIIDPGDDVIIFDPYFVLYFNLIKLLGGNPIPVSTYPDFTIKKELLEKAVTPKTKLIIVNSPNNPTGKIISPAEMQIIIEVAKKCNLWILSDEVYSLFDYDNTFTSFYDKYEKLLIVNAFSKTYAIAGWRLGYLIGPKEVIDKISIIQQFSFVCAPSIAQKAVELVYPLSTKNFVRIYKKNRDIVYSVLSKFLEVQKPEGSFYIFPKLPDNITGTDFAHQLLKEKVVVVPGHAFSQQDTHIRISFATDTKILKKGLEIIARLLQR
ncbi:MAG: pyridoxal phosphate-dependent aminotransferase [Planctomycetota bacterium]